jgi:hypothetical protein
MLQKTADEFLGSQRAILGFAGSRGLIAESHLAIRQLHNAVVADGYPEDVRRQILQGGQSVANQLVVHDPILIPHGIRDIVKARSFSQGITEFGSKYPGEGFHRQQEVLPGDQLGLSIRSQPNGWDQEVHMRMVDELAIVTLSPSVPP